MKRHNKLFIFILPVFILLAIGILSLSLKKLNIFKGAESGCGCDVKTATGEFQPNESQAIFMDQLVNPPLTALAEPKTSVLGDSSSGQKWIEIDLSEQKLTAWDNGNKYFETLISSGKWGRTPTGEYNIWGKYKYTKMSGGNKEDHTYYYLPNVPYTMYFYKGFGLHGTYWHNNFGQPMSHGCVNLPTVSAEKIFYWSTPTLPSGKNSVMASKDDPGTKVVIHE